MSANVVSASADVKAGATLPGGTATPAGVELVSPASLASSGSLTSPVSAPTGSSQSVQSPSGAVQSPLVADSPVQIASDSNPGKSPRRSPRVVVVQAASSSPESPTHGKQKAKPGKCAGWLQARVEKLNAVVSKHPRYHHSLFLFDKDSPFRLFCHRFTNNDYLPLVMTFFILANCFTSAARVVGEYAAGSQGYTALLILDIVFSVVFTSELLMKVVASGFIIGDDAYLRSRWNVFDLVMVIIGYLVYGVGDFTYLRMLRLMSIFQRSTIFEEMRVMTVALIKAFPQLVSVMFLLAFISHLFAVIFLNLYQGKLRQRCFDLAPGSPPYPFQSTDIAGCSSWWMNGTGFLNYTQYPLENHMVFCNPDSGTSGHHCDAATQCCGLVISDQDAFYGGVVSYDNIAKAWLSIVVLLSYQGWSDQMYAIGDALSKWNYPLFILVVTVASTFAVKLFIAVLFIRFEQTRSAELKKPRLGAKGERVKLATIVPEVLEQMIKHTRDVLKRSSTHKDNHASQTNLSTVSSPAAKYEAKEDEAKDAAKDAVTGTGAGTPPPAAAESAAAASAGTTAASSDAPAGAAAATAAAPAAAAAAAGGPEPLKTSSGEAPFNTSTDNPTASPTSATGNAATTSVAGAASVAADSKDSKDGKDAGAANAQPQPPAKAAEEPNSAREYDKLPWTRCEPVERARARTRVFLKSWWYKGLIASIIVSNSITLATVHQGMTQSQIDRVNQAGLAFTVMFLLEFAVKNFALGIRSYWRAPPNRYEGFVLALTLLTTFAFGTNVFSVLQSFRLLLLVQFWPSMTRLVQTILSSLGNLAYYCLLMAMFIFVWAVGAVQLIGHKEGTGLTEPRDNFDTFGWSLVETFQVMSMENWNGVLQDAGTAVGWGAAAFLAVLYVLGNFVIVSLFTAILLANFGETAEREEEENAKKLEEERKKRDEELRERERKREEQQLQQQQQQSEKSLKSDKSEKSSRHLSRASTGVDSSVDQPVQSRWRQGLTRLIALVRFEEAKGKHAVAELKITNKQHVEDERLKTADKLPIIHHQTKKVLELATKIPRHLEDVKTCFIFDSNNLVRRVAHAVITHPIFEWFVLLTIFVSCVLLALDAPLLDPKSGTGKAVYSGDRLVLAVFFVEAGLKIIALGFVLHPGSYLRDHWNKLDLLILLTSTISTLSPSTFGSFPRAVRALRALRSLRLVSSFDDARAVIGALTSAFFYCLNVLGFGLVLFLAMATIGVHYFNGILDRCYLPNSPNVGPWSMQFGINAPGYAMNISECLANGGLWRPPLDISNLDNVGAAFLTLFEFATEENWPTLMYDMVDASTYGNAPQQYHNKWAALFPELGIVIFTFFYSNLFVGSVVDAYQKHLAELNKSLDTSVGHSQFMQVYKNLLSHSPEFHLEMPEVKEQFRRRRNSDSVLPLVGVPAVPSAAVRCLKRAKKFLRKLNPSSLVVHPYFDNVMLAVTAFNLLVLSLTFYGEPTWWTATLNAFNDICSICYMLEAAIKLYAYGFTLYFSTTWNRIDFILMLCSLVDFLADCGAFNLHQPGLDPQIFRVVRVLRSIKLLEKFPSQRQLVLTLRFSLPSIYQVCIPMAIWYFMYAVAGMAMFGTVNHGNYIDDYANFQDFPTALMTLIRTSFGGENWNGLMRDSMVQPPFCDFNQTSCVLVSPPTCCGSVTEAVGFWVSFNTVCVFLLLSLVVAIIIKNFENEYKGEGDDMQSGDQLPVSVTDIERYGELWQKISPTQSMKIDRLPDFIQSVMNADYGVPPEEKVSYTPQQVREWLHIWAPHLDELYQQPVPGVATGGAAEGKKTDYGHHSKRALWNEEAQFNLLAQLHVPYNQSRRTVHWLDVCYALTLRQLRLSVRLLEPLPRDHEAVESAKLAALKRFPTVVDYNNWAEDRSRLAFKKKLLAMEQRAAAAVKARLGKQKSSAKQ